MTTLKAALSEQLQNDILRIRSAAADFGEKRPGCAVASLHGAISSAETALDMLDGWLLDEEQKQLLRLNPWDVFLLHASAYIFAVADMVVSGSTCDIKTDRESVPDTPPPLVQDHRTFVLDHWSLLGLRDVAAAAAIADICQDIGGDLSPEVEGAAASEHVFDGMAANCTLLSAAVRLALALNPEAASTQRAIKALVPAGATISADAYETAFSITQSGPHPYLTATIRLNMQCRDAELHRAFKQHERRVQKLLHRLNRVASPRFLFSDVLFEIETSGYSPMDLKFSVDTSAALKLLTGNRLYADNRVFLRELIQNAVDACNLRRRLEQDYAPAISVRFNEDISQVTVRDNGIGMDRQWIEKYFLTIGISLYQSAEVRRAGQRSRIDFNFISQFGIGFLSSFLVADKIVIKTRKEGSTGLMICITNLRDYFDVRDLEADFEAGTEVTLHLKPSKINYCRSLEYVGYLKTNIRFLDVPVQLEDQTGKVTTLGCETLSYANPKTRDIDFEAPLAFKHSKGYLLLRAKLNVDHIFTVETARGGVSVFQDGIFITQLDSLLPEGARQHVVGRINLLGKEKCALSMDRNRIFWTDTQLREIKHTLLLGLADAVDRFMTAVDEQGTASNTRQSIVNQLATFFDFNEVDNAVYAKLSQPLRQVVEKRFRDFLRIHFAHTFRSEGIPEADGYNHDWQRRIVNSFRKN